jgi:hypothetical protein
MPYEVTIDISPDGKTVTVEGHGFSGTDCKAVTEAVEKALGVQVRVTRKPEWHRTQPVAKKVGR